MANEKRLIDANELAKEYQFTEDHTSPLTPWEITDILDILNEAPTVDAVEVVHGRWVNNKNDYPECDKCGYMPQYDPMIDDIWYSPYCPNCGAKMMDLKGE